MDMESGMPSRAQVQRREPAEPQYLSAKECLAKAVLADEIARNENQSWTKDLYEKIAQGWREAALWSASQSSAD
jgi:hypothetical protein